MFSNLKKDRMEISDRYRPSDFKKEELEFKSISISKLRDNSKNFFSPLPPSKYSELKNSIIQLGVLEPLLVRPVGGGYYEIISGHNRKKALVEIGVNKVPCYIRNVDEDEAFLMLMDANTKKRELTPMEIAKTLKFRKEIIGKRQGRKNAKGIIGRTTEYISQDLHISGRSAANYIKLNNLVEDLQVMLDSGGIGLTTAFELSEFTAESQDKIKRMSVLNRVTLTLNRVKRMKKKAKKSKDNKLYTIGKNEIYMVLKGLDKKSCFDLKPGDKIEFIVPEKIDEYTLEFLQNMKKRGFQKELEKAIYYYMANFQ